MPNTLVTIQIYIASYSHWNYFLACNENGVLSSSPQTFLQMKRTHFVTGHVM